VKGKLSVRTMVVTILGVVPPLCLYIDSKLEKVVSALAKESKEFHERLCAIEERMGK